MRRVDVVIMGVTVVEAHIPYKTNDVDGIKNKKVTKLDNFFTYVQTQWNKSSFNEISLKCIHIVIHSIEIFVYCQEVTRRILYVVLVGIIIP